MAHEELTDQQNRVLKFIQRSLLNSGYPPTLREIGVEFGIRSTNGVSDHLKALMRKGYITKETGKSRTLTLLNPKSKLKTPVKLKLPKGIPIYQTLNERPIKPFSEGLFAIFNSNVQEITIYKSSADGVLSILSNFHFAI